MQCTSEAAVPPGRKSSTDANHEDRQPTRRQRIAVGAVCTFAALAVYVLSAGPMVWIARMVRLKQFDTLLQLVYAPLAFVVKHDLQPLSTLLKWYAGLFR
jgi:hypothetical protein